jgi:hypothetical protein
MVMPNRKTPAAGNTTYRYGFNGKENDGEKAAILTSKLFYYVFKE